MVWTWIHGIDNTHGIDLDSWYRIGTPESHKYKRAECCPYAGYYSLDINKCYNMNMFYQQFSSFKLLPFCCGIQILFWGHLNLI